MAAYTIQTEVPGGLEVTFAAVAGTSGAPDSFANSLQKPTRLRVNNASAASVTVTIKAQQPCEQRVLHDLTGTVAAGATEDFGPFDRHYIKSDGTTEVYYSATASVTAAAVREA